MSNLDKLGLNEAQKDAVSTISGPLLILAGAGAGKTKTITERIRHLVKTGIAPSSILAITFTNKAAREMRDRIEKGWETAPPGGAGDEKPFVSTFHSLGVHILREQAHILGIKKYFVVFDRGESRAAVKEALTQFGLDPKTHDPGRILGVISKEKGRGLTCEEFREAQGTQRQGYFIKVVSEVWPEYEKILKRDSALDFDDLLLKTRNLLRDEAGVRRYYQEHWTHIHIDEYQDTNRVQYEIAKMLVGSGDNICAVGDIDQNIYSWRGADIKNILDFEADYPSAKVVLLEENYRSSKNILDAANAVIEKNKMRRKKNLFTKSESGEKIIFAQNIDEIGEAEYVASKVKELMAQGTPPEEIAVLYRANFQSRILEEAFMTAGLPYQMLGTRFFERQEVKDVISYLRAALNPESLSDLKRIINTPARGIGKTTVLKIFANQEEGLPSGTRAKLKSFRELLDKIAVVAREKIISETLTFIIKTSTLEEEWKKGGEEGEARLENAYELVNFASRYNHLPSEVAVANLLSDVALQSDQDELDEGKRAVRLMTVHAAKGLEFDVVFITGLEEGLFPHQGLESDKTPEENEEERRLFYVALTRARKKVFLSSSEVRTIFGRRQINIPSQFIFDIPESLVDYEIRNEATPRRPLLEIEF